MSERTSWRVFQQYSWTIRVVDNSGAAVTGLVNANFTKYLALDDVNSAVTVTVTEIDSVNLPGLYKVTYTPNALGHWCCVVTNATYNAAGWIDEVQTDPVFGTYATVVDTSPAANAFKTSLASSVDDFWRDQLIVFLNGNLAGQCRLTSAYDGSSAKLTVAQFTQAPANGDKFYLVPAAIDLDLVVVDTYTRRQAQKLVLSESAGKVSGAPGSPVFRSADDSTNRITATCDANGNRTAVTLNGN